MTARPIAARSTAQQVALWLTRSVSLIAVLIINVILQGFVLFPMSIQLGQSTVPWLMGHGLVLYRDILEHRPPLSAWIVTLVQPLLGGDTFFTLRLLHLLTVLATVVLVYAVTGRLSKSRGAATLGILYYTALQVVFVNIAFYFEVILGLLFIGVITLLVQPPHDQASGRGAMWRAAAAGVLLSLAFFSKQQAVLAIVFVVMGCLWDKMPIPSLAALLLGLIVPTVIVWGLYAAGGLWSDYYYWNFTFNAQFGGGLGGELNGDFIRRLTLTHSWLLPFALMSFRQVKGYWLVFGLGIVAMVFQYPRLGEIHAAAALPMVSVAAGVVLAHLLPALRLWRSWTAETAIALGCALVLLVGIFTNVATSFIPTPAGFRTVIGMDDLRPIVGWLKAHSTPNDTLIVLPNTDSTAQVQPLAGLLPPKTWFTGNQYGLGPTFVTERLVKEWNVTPPTWVVLFPQLTAETIPPQAQPLLDFVDDHYTLAYKTDPLPFYGEADIMRLKK